LGTLKTNTERCTHGLNSKGVVDIGQDKTGMAKYMFDIDGCSYGQIVQHLREIRENEVLTRN
jgi:hypothetical protein